MLTRTGVIEPANSPAATIGVWGTTSRPRTTVRRAPLPTASAGGFSQIQRVGNPLINELLIGTGFKDRFSMDQPKNDAQFANQFFLDPSLARVVNALTNGAVAIPAPPRTDLLPVVTYAPPIAAPGTPAGPVADLLRLNTGVAATPPASANRLGVLGGERPVFPAAQSVGRRDRHRAPIGRRWCPRGPTVLYLSSQQQAGRWRERQRCAVSDAVPLSRQCPKRTNPGTSTQVNVAVPPTPVRHACRRLDDEGVHNAKLVFGNHPRRCCALHRAGTDASAAERRIAAAERRIAANPRSHDGYNDLALGLAQRARDTADAAFYQRAKEAVRRSLELDPGNLEGKKMRVWVLLGKHQFAAALELARSLNKQIPDDVQSMDFSPTPTSSWETTKKPKKHANGCSIFALGMCRRSPVRRT